MTIFIITVLDVKVNTTDYNFVSVLRAFGAFTNQNLSILNKNVLILEADLVIKILI